ncbi:DUF1549 and DUF1553 domain-containing protein [Pirellulaceae bacterium SH501]
MRATCSIVLLVSTTGVAIADEGAESTSLPRDQQILAELRNPNNPIRQLFGESRLQLWSLRPISRPVIPSVQQEAWVWNPVDAFLLSQWESSKQKPAPDIDNRNWLRRLRVHLTGLPLTTSDVEKYEQATPLSRDTEQVDEWLNSPRYGEHWARMWLDVVRYSDSNGFDWDEFRPKAWKFRNYVIRAFNRDKPFDRFVLEQIAGDELVADAPKSSDAASSDIDAESYLEPLIASGYLRLGPYDNAAKLFQEEDRARAEWMADLTETTASAFLGLTMGCCRCHDHKTDPLSHADHYRLKAFFAACQLDDGQSDVLTVRESVDKVDSTRVFYQGDHRQPREEVEPGFPSVLYPATVSIQTPSHGKTTGRRSVLARWIGSGENPWAARVLVNRLWQHHFGTGLVETPNDFGWTGATPSNLPLLDFLASELIESGWSIKAIQRLIVTSHAYRQMAVSDAMRSSSPEYRAWASPRKSLHRLKAEELRDSILYASGLLTLENVEKPVWPELSQDVLQTNPAILDDNKEKTKGWYPSPPTKQTVRSLYLIQKRTLRLPWMETFDQPENATSCGRRDVSIVAPQALAQLNSELAVQAAETLSRSLNTPSSDKEEVVLALFERVLGRLPTEDERTRSVRFLEQASVAELANVLLNTNEFLFVP